MNKKFIKTMLSVFLVAVTTGIILPAEAISNTGSNKEYSIRLDKATIAKGYTVAAFKDKLKLSLVPGILSEATPVEILELNEPLPMPWKLDRLSPVYQFEFKNKAAYDNHKPYYIQMSYSPKSTTYKQVFFYDKNFFAWRPLPTKDYADEKFVRSLIHLPFARIAVFSYTNVMGSGRASWYGYKGGNFAASPDFPKGSKLRVFNYNKTRFVDVVINDYGPERGLFPDRAIDLDKVAFAKIAPLGAGIIDISIEPIYIVPDMYGSILGINPAGIGEYPGMNVKSAVVIDEDTGNILLSKNATTTLPLASLTKLVAIKVFLDTKPSLNTVVTYKKQDEEYNYEYCKPWESAKIDLKEGDTMFVEDLLYAALVGSANNTIETLVRASGLLRSDFMLKMNNSVKNWGASSTYFVEPTGLAPENVSSVADYGIISKEVLSHPIIKKASIMPTYEFTTINTERSFKVRNTNHIIKTNKYNITGSKTGYLDEALYCLMVRVKAPNGKNIIVVTLGADTRDKSFYETSKLIEFGLRNISTEL